MEKVSSQSAMRSSRGTETRSINLNERLALIALIDESARLGFADTPIASDLFSDLWDLVNATASGSRIDRLKPEEMSNGFRTFEINAETGENLGRLNMLYLKKPVPCYYLVYVEVEGPFRRKGLGSRILEYFKDFLVEKSAIGVLDNIIPEEDPSYSIYAKQGWEPLEAFLGDGAGERENHFMIYVPSKWQGKELRDPISKMIYHLKRKRAAIDMRDNEVMVQRTIGEFRGLYAALLTYFSRELQTGKTTPLTQYMFTRFVTKLISFRRRIGTLIGYTGGDSIEQIVLDPVVAALPVRTYPPAELSTKSPSAVGDKELWDRLPGKLKNDPARFIESLPNYARPSFVSWLRERGMASTQRLTIGDLMNLGFDPTRLKEIVVDNEKFIFERIHARQLPELRNKEEVLRRIEMEMPHAKPGNAQLRINPPLLTIEDRGNAYVLRRKVDGIHWEEAIEQIQSAPHLKSMNEIMKIDRVILGAVRMAQQAISETLGLKEETLTDSLTCFVSWDLEGNLPRLLIDFTSTYLESVWMA
jgi:GNAT superfamily N-acetyltransferase